MEKLKLKDFKKYVKEEYNCDISTKESANPDTFDNIFNGNFINTDLMVDKILNKQDFTNKDMVIIVDANKDYKFQRVIIAYELACYLIEYMPKYNDKNNVYSHPYNSEIDIIHKCSMEMLMPKKVFTEQYAKAIKKSDFNMTYTLTYLSELFKVPEVEIKNRIIDILEEK